MTHSYGYDALHKPRITSQETKPECVRIIHLQFLFDYLPCFLSILIGHRLIHSIRCFSFRQLLISRYSLSSSSPPAETDIEIMRFALLCPSPVWPLCSMTSLFPPLSRSLFFFFNLPLWFLNFFIIHDMPHVIY